MQTLEALNYFTSILSVTTEDVRESLKKKILNNELPWHDIVEIANNHFMIPALYYSLKQKELYKIIRDEQLKNYLHEIFMFNTMRNKGILRQLNDVQSICKGIKLSPVFLKGAATLIEEDYSHIAIRGMTDIDILLPENFSNSALEYFKVSGYEQTTYKSLNALQYINMPHQLDAMTKKNMPASLELHLTIDASNLLPFSKSLVRKSSNPNFPNVFVLKPTYMIFHAFIHTEIQDNNYKLKQLDIRHIYDFVILVNKYQSEIEWNLLYELVKSKNLTENFYSYLYACKMLFALKTPFEVDKMTSKRNYLLLLSRFDENRTIQQKLFFVFNQAPIILSYRRLQERYKFKCSFYYPYYLIKHIAYLGKKGINSELF